MTPLVPVIPFCSDLMDLGGDYIALIFPWDEFFSLVCLLPLVVVVLGKFFFSAVCRPFFQSRSRPSAPLPHGMEDASSERPRGCPFEFFYHSLSSLLKLVGAFFSTSAIALFSPGVYLGPIRHHDTIVG